MKDRLYAALLWLRRRWCSHLYSPALTRQVGSLLYVKCVRCGHENLIGLTR